MIALAESGYHEPVNVGNPNEFTLLELAEAVIDVTGSSSEIVFEALPDRRPEDPPAEHRPGQADPRLGAHGGAPRGPAAHARRVRRRRTRRLRAIASRAHRASWPGARNAFRMTNPRHLPPSPVEERKMPKANPADLGSVDLPPLELPLPDRDMRSKRPPVLSFLLRWSTLRQAARVVSLLALDLARHHPRDLHRLVLEGGCARRLGSARLVGAVQGLRAVRVPGRLAAVRAVGPLRGARAAPRPDAHRRLAVSDDARGADLRRRQRRGVLQLLHLLRHALLLGRLRVDRALRLRAGHGGAAAAPPATSAARSSSAPASRSRPSPTRCRPRAGTARSRSSASSR